MYFKKSWCYAWLRPWRPHCHASYRRKNTEEYGSFPKWTRCPYVWGRRRRTSEYRKASGLYGRKGHEVWHLLRLSCALGHSHRKTFLLPGFCHVKPLPLRTWNKRKRRTRFQTGSCPQCNWLFPWHIFQPWYTPVKIHKTQHRSDLVSGLCQCRSNL